jgi:hypothetical protein
VKNLRQSKRRKMLKVIKKDREYILHIPSESTLDDTFWVELQFQFLYEKWKEERRLLSLMRDIQNTPSYQKIMALGNRVLPFIFRSMEEKPDWWFLALKIITQANPVLPEHIGNLQSMTNDWLLWAKEQKMY